MFLNTLFTLSSGTTDSGEFKTLFFLNPEHPIFEGHFPDQPVLPGVCMMQIVKAAIELQFGKSIRLSKAQELKFLSVIVPRAEKMFEIKFNLVDNHEGLIQVTAQITDEAQTYFKFKGAFVQQ